MDAEDNIAGLAAEILRFRQARAEVLPGELFGEIAWEFLLELFVADTHSKRITGREICSRRSVDFSIGSRWMVHLTKLGLIIGDGDGDLDEALALSGSGLERMEQLLGH